MKIFTVLFCSCILFVSSFGQSMHTEIAIIPKPVSIIENTGYFSLPQDVLIEAGTEAGMKPVIAFLKDRLSTPTGSSVTVKSAAPIATIKLVLNKKAETVIGKEGYHLLSTPKNIIITANEPAGLFYGVQTLVQLFPKEIESAVPVKQVKWIAPCVSITDYPRFGWRA